MRRIFRTWRLMAEVLCPLPRDKRWQVYIASLPQEGLLWEEVGMIEATTEDRAVHLAAQFYERRPLDVLVEKTTGKKS